MNILPNFVPGEGRAIRERPNT